MQALILAGGEGTRLRPLTLNVPKPVLPLAGRPFLTFMLDWARRHGVDDVLLSCGYRSDHVERVLGQSYRGMRLRYVVESEPLGTAGPVRLALDEGLLAERFLVLNGDCLADLDLSAELAQHERTGAVATLALCPAEDTSSYGVVPTAPNGEVEDFLEKTAAPAPTNRVNAGAYVLERRLAKRIAPGRAVSFELEIFPELVGAGLYGFDADGYWIDIGTPERYLEATYDLLDGRAPSELRARDARNSLVADGVDTDAAEVGPFAVVGRACTLGRDAAVVRSVLFDEVAVGAGCRINEAIVADGCRLGDGARVEDGAVLGEGATVDVGATVAAGARVDPGARIRATEAID